MSTSAIFNGNSRYATDFQSVIDRSVAIASLPLDQLNNTKNDLTAESSALSGLDTKFAALQSAITGLGQATGLSAFAATASDPSAVRTHVAGGVREASYTIDVVSLGAQTSTMSNDGLVTVADPDSQNISSAATFTLTVNGTAYTVTPATPTLNGLADAINAVPGADVAAAIVNVGNSTAPDYRLVITGTRYRNDSITLSDGSQDLTTVLTSGANTEYRINGGTTISNDTRNITLAPGLTLDLLDETAPGNPVTVSVARSPDALRDNLSSFIDAYNACVDELDKQRGQGAGALEGQVVVSTLSGTLHSLVTTADGSGAITSLGQLGVVLDAFGHLSLDATTFDAATAGGVRDAFAFLGSPSGGGFLGTAAALLQSVEDTSSGILKSAISANQAQITEQDKLIADNQDRIDQLRESLSAQMAAADALIASMEQQVNYFNGLFEAMRTNQQSLNG